VTHSAGGSSIDDAIKIKHCSVDERLSIGVAGNISQGQPPVTIEHKELAELRLHTHNKINGDILFFPALHISYRNAKRKGRTLVLNPAAEQQIQQVLITTVDENGTFRWY